MTSRQTYSSAWEAVSATITSGTSVTDSIDLGGLRLFGIDTPTSWTTANVTLQSFGSDGVWRDVKDENGSEIVISAAASAAIRFRDPTLFASLTTIRLRSGTSLTPVVQAADRSVSLILRSI